MTQEPLEIIVDGTPNPNALKFTLNRVVATKGETYRGNPDQVPAAWAKALLGIQGIIGVFGINNFISINKASDAEWQVIVPQAEAALKAVFAGAQS